MHLPTPMRHGRIVLQLPKGGIIYLGRRLFEEADDRRSLRGSI